MADPTEYVEVTYKLEMKTKLPRKTHYAGMTNQEIWDHEEDPANAVENIISALQEEGADDILTVKVKFTSDLEEEIEEE